SRQLRGPEPRSCARPDRIARKHLRGPSPSTVMGAWANAAPARGCTAGGRGTALGVTRASNLRQGVTHGNLGRCSRSRCPRDPAYGKFNTGYTSTLWKADPKSRIVAVDPKLIPYGSWVWVEGLGWYRAEDCGSAIKGFRLDLLTATERDAMTFGKQNRFVIVVPSADA